MQGNRSRDTKPELAVRSAVHRRGMRFRVAARPQPELPRTADLVLRKSRVAVFVDGCYWHGCPEHHTQPATNAEYWADKIAGNVDRDAETTDYLEGAGWTVLRFWEHEDPRPPPTECSRRSGPPYRAKSRAQRTHTPGASRTGARAGPQAPSNTVEVAAPGLDARLPCFRHFCHQEGTTPC